MFIGFKRGNDLDDYYFGISKNKGIRRMVKHVVSCSCLLILTVVSIGGTIVFLTYFERFFPYGVQSAA